MDWVDYLFSFKGRINRAKYWLFFVIVFGVILVSVMIAAVFIGISKGQGKPMASLPPFEIAAAIVGILVGLGAFGVLMISSFAIYVKRLHDRDKSAWWIIPFVILPSLLRGIGDAFSGTPDSPTGVGALLSLISLPLSIWAFVEIGCLRGTVGSNRFGPDPLGGPDGDVAKVFE